jgi:hypothetical protein
LIFPLGKAQRREVDTLGAGFPVEFERWGHAIIAEQIITNKTNKAPFSFVGEIIEKENHGKRM